MKSRLSLRWSALLVCAGLFTAGSLSAQTNTSAPSPAAPNGAEPTRKVDLNTADIPTLEAIPEIGVDFANAVVAARPFKSVDDLGRVLKLSPEKMTSLRGKVWVSPVSKVAAPATPAPGTAKTSKPAAANEGKATAGQEVTERYDRAQAKEPAANKK